jgi:hypothetical protein
MIDRRELLALGGMLGGLAARGNDAEGAAIGTAEVTDRTAQEIVEGLRSLTNAISGGQSFSPIVPVRTKQIDYLKANSKFPDFIDVGIDVWMRVYDWHVRLQQPLVVGRDPSGRYMLLMGFTQLVLRPDFVSDYISVPYDASDRR